MHRLSLTFLCLSILFRLVLSLSPTYSACQSLKSDGESALTGCPNGTLYVSQTDPTANYISVQEAIDALPSTGDAVILVGVGSYSGSVNVSRAAPLTLLGQIQSGSASQGNSVLFWNAISAKDGTTDEETPTLTVAPKAGYSFGSIDFKAYNIDFENRAANYSIAPALVVSITLANASFYGCTFQSWQDTHYTGFGANMYAVNCTVYGQVDYLFGCGRAWFQSVILANRGCGGGITAWQGIYGTTNGVYIADSKIIRSPDINPDIVTDGSCSLGRPWNEYALTVYLRSYMDSSVHPAGFSAWSIDDTLAPTTYYAESGSHGPGGNTSARLQQEYILTSEEAQIYTLEYVFDGTPGWIDYDYQY